MVQAGRSTETAARRYTADGYAADTPRLNVELFREAYTDELADFTAAVRARRDATPPPSGDFTLTPGAADARRALAVALACIESVKQGGPVAVPASAKAGV
jgi:myo-inositol 2-dehydrogenase/D-chiro-inositol 1-dehydrogenase